MPAYHRSEDHLGKRGLLAAAEAEAEVAGGKLGLEWIFPAPRGSRDARNRDPGLQSVKGAHFDFDYSSLGPWEQHTACSVMRLVI